MADTLWSIVLAAGNGRRLAPVTRGTPKQFWSLDGRPSLLEETFSRIGSFAPPERTTVVVDRRHEPYVQAAARPWPAQWLLYQPDDRGTAAGVLLAMTPVLDSSPDGIVLLTPSDHGVADPDRFRAGVREAVNSVRSRHVDVVLFGVEPSEPVTEYGWIVPGQACAWTAGQSFRRVDEFVEKPPIEVAHRLFAAHALWHTMVVVARVSVLLDLYRAHLPHLTKVFATYRHRTSSARRHFLSDAYATLPAADFSRDVLMPATNLAVYGWPRALGWSDLGTPDRLARWLGALPARLSA